MTELILHIGHGKTGTSAIQSWLALNRNLIADIGYDYPEHRSFSTARRGFISSGNGQLIFEDGFDVGSNTLLSNELLFRGLAKDNALEKLLKRFDCNLRVVLYSRNLFDFLTSLWGQHVKRNEGTETLNEYLLDGGGHHFHVLYRIEASERLGFELVLKNYSVHRDNLIADFLSTVFGAAGERIAADPSQAAVRTVNRSLTEAEYAIQRAFNRYTDKSFRYISDALVNELPDIPAETCFIEPAVYRKVVDRMSGAIDRINAFIEPGERLEIEAYDDLSARMNPPAENGRLTITEAQIDVLARRLAGEIHKAMRPADAALLAEIARKIERGETPDLQDALHLLTFAQQARPDKPINRKQIDEIRKRLGVEGDG